MSAIGRSLASPGQAPGTRLGPATDPRARRWPPLAAGLVVAATVLLTAYVLLGVGNVLSPVDVWRALVREPDVPRLHEIAVGTRLPRGVFALLVGAALGVAGALLQAVTRNPLASPDLTGVTAGAVAMTAAVAAFAPRFGVGELGWAVPLVATGGGLATAALVYLLTRGHGTVESTRFILIGILVGGILSSVATFSLLLLGLSAAKLFEWLSGSLLGITWGDVAIALGYLSVGAVLLAVSVPRANALQLGDDVAVALGHRRERDRFLVLLTAALLTAAAVSAVGAIGFVGLLAPHLVRRSVGSDLRRLVPAAALVGAVMVVAADLLARNLDPAWVTGSAGGSALQAGPLPAGVYLALFGIPFLVSLLWRSPN
jgi:iron complex transport system permease protein